MSYPEERPSIRVLMAQHRGGQRVLSVVVDLLDVPRHQKDGWQFIGMDPADELCWLEWRERHPEAS